MTLTVPGAPVGWRGAWSTRGASPWRRRRCRSPARPRRAGLGHHDHARRRHLRHGDGGARGSPGGAPPGFAPRALRVEDPSRPIRVDSARAGALLNPRRRLPAGPRRWRFALLRPVRLTAGDGEEVRAERPARARDARGGGAGCVRVGQGRGAGSARRVDAWSFARAARPRRRDARAATRWRAQWWPADAPEGTTASARSDRRGPSR